MTISTTDSRISYNGNGVTTAFAFPYRFFENADLVVELVDAAGAVTAQVLNTDYTVTGADLDAGGTVTMVTPPASGERLVIRRVVEATQETDYISGDPFPAESHERALDRLTMLVQQNQEALTRTLQLPPTSEADASTIDVEAVETLAAIASDITTVALIEADVTTVAGVAADVTNVAGIASSVTTVAGIAADVSAVAAIDTDVSTVAAAVPDIQAAVADLPALAGKANSGAVGSSLLTMTTARVLGRTTASTGPIEELTASQVSAFAAPASTTAQGVVELATNAEAQAGTDTSRAITAANLKAAQIQLATAITLTTQTSVDFTGIPSFAKRVTVFFTGVSSSGTSLHQVQVGTGGVPTTSGYAGQVARAGASGTAYTSNNTGFLLAETVAAASVFRGKLVLERIGSGNDWKAVGDYLNNGQLNQQVGDISLAGALDIVRLTTVNGTDLLDLGQVNISWE